MQGANKVPDKATKRSYEDLETELAITKGRLMEGHRTHKIFMTFCDSLLAVNVFMFLLLVAVGIGWI